MLSAPTAPLQEPEAEKLQLPNKALSPLAPLALSTPASRTPYIKFLELPRDRGAKGLRGSPLFTQGATGFPGAAGRVGPPGSNVSALLVGSSFRAREAQAGAAQSCPVLTGPHPCAHFLFWDA